MLNSPTGRRKRLPHSRLIPTALLLGLAGLAQDGVPLPQVEVAGLTNPAGAKVILINAKGDGCRDSVVLPLDAQYYDAKSRVLQIGSSVDANCWCSDPEAKLAGLAVLARDRAVAYFRNERKRTTLPYPLCAKRDNFMVTMRPRREVDIHVWAPSVRLRSMAKDDIANADWILDKELAGITLRPTFHKEKEILAQIGCQSQSDENCCPNAVASEAYQPGAINMYYGTGAANLTCRDDGVIFIHQVPVLGDAAHELGHALGLFQTDAGHSVYDHGHTTHVNPFQADNVMWTRTQYLKDKLSAGQAFWMSQSCTSYLVFSGSCLTCSETAGTPSPCPLFSLGHQSVASPSGVCEVKPGQTIAAAASPAASIGEVPTSIFCSPLELKADLSLRYIALKQHVRLNRNLDLGAILKSDFLDHWMPEYQLPVEAEPARKGAPKPVRKTPVK